jgi:FtsH-binding integral membrane protein
LTASIFLITSIYGLITKKNLDTVGHYCIMGLWGIIISIVANIFFIHSSMFDLVISWIGVAVFIGLIAYDSQKIKDRAAYVGIISENSIAMLGAIELYLDFINLFLKLLRIFGKRK